tara:strand:+ start:209 stop:838 length:630 start_codon:yes stop_codon:yes gene_type:complete
MFLQPLYSKPLYGVELDFDTKPIVSYLTEDKFKPRSFDIGLGQSNNMGILEEPEFADLKILLQKEFDKFAKEQMAYSNKFEITTSWVTEAKTGQASRFHNHNNCMWSGCFYLQVDENTGDIVFQDFNDKRYMLNVTENNILNSWMWTIKPVKGMFLIWPAEVYHKIMTNNSKMNRYSLAMNFMPVGHMGDPDGDSQVIQRLEKINVQTN